MSTPTQTYRKSVPRDTLSATRFLGLFEPLVARDAARGLAYHGLQRHIAANAMLARRKGSFHVAHRPLKVRWIGSFGSGSRSARAASPGSRAGTPVIRVESGASAGASSTVALSAEGLKALDDLGKTTFEAVQAGVSATVDEVEHLALEVWHGLESGAADFEHLAKVGWEDVKLAAVAVENFTGSALQAVKNGASSLASSASEATKEVVDLGGSALSTSGDVLSGATGSVVFLVGAGVRAIRSVV